MPKGMTFLRREEDPVFGLVDVYQDKDCTEITVSADPLVNALGKAAGLEWELNEAVDLMVRVARGEQTIERMAEWVSMNFPKFRDRLLK